MASKHKTSLEGIDVQLGQSSNQDLMIAKINEIRNALALHLYNCALALALTLPDICAKVEYRDRSDLGKGAKYRTWFDTYAKHKFTYQATQLPAGSIVPITTIDGKTCWKLRCAVLHAGNFSSEGGADRKYNQITVHAHKSDSYFKEHEIVDGKKIELDVNRFCLRMCEAAETYYNNSEDKSAFDVDEVRILTW